MMSHEMMIPYLKNQLLKQNFEIFNISLQNFQQIKMNKKKKVNK